MSKKRARGLDLVPLPAAGPRWLAEADDAWRTRRPVFSTARLEAGSNGKSNPLLDDVAQIHRMLTGVTHGKVTVRYDGLAQFFDAAQPKNRYGECHVNE